MRGCAVRQAQPLFVTKGTTKLLLIISATVEDKELLEKFAHPESRNLAYNQLVRKYQQKVYWHIRKMVIDHDDADDLTQEVFIKIWKNLENFRQDSQLYTWIYRIATNECLSFLSSKKRKFFLPINDITAELMEKVEASPDIAGDEVQLKLQKAILRLPDKQRLVFNMKYFDEMKYEEMSAILGTSVGALKASYHLAVKKIEEFLKQD
ncbi:RNA polymerase sigma-70 factor (ECF subfamily) [Pontibacter ummariensis]|uniref:RNA polymerase sigma factor n=1 Tax=Pontibacter ummariensis TaxID=1610492 RepID=A0A239J820_9BACT|nr:RNA polymerase sigma-70 factor (ECF subfamily) [Pontibacter ummariensis]SNT01648.1 RNA polymerase sigma-70 factor, ECF subfamily [Pontibacter ummariensis]